jgi:hypothetical protein
MTAQQTVSAQLDSTLVAARVPLDQIPVIDFGPFLIGSAAERKAWPARSARPAATSVSST